ncbi:MAG: hypothetical protein ABIG44_07345 [Planctomycetota bacterium]
MPAKKKRLTRGLLIGVLALPLLETGTCLNMTQDALVDGFFEAVTPVLIEQVKTELGLATTSNDSGNDGES